jgi:hypothetical protein
MAKRNKKEAPTARSYRFFGGCQKRLRMKQSAAATAASATMAELTCCWLAAIEGPEITAHIMQHGIATRAREKGPATTAPTVEKERIVRLAMYHRTLYV